MKTRPLIAPLLLLAGCLSSTPVAPSPLPPAEEAELRCTLLGSWRLAAIDGEPNVASEQTWTFRADGTGTYQQRAMVSGTRVFEWSLDGRNIRLSGGAEVTYRADDFDEETMEWFNYTLSDNFLLERVASGDDC